MNALRTSAAGLATSAILLSATMVGCGSEKSPSVTSMTSSSAPATSGTTAGANPEASPSDYSNLLIKASDIGPTARPDGPPTTNPHGTPGVTQAFKNGDYSVADMIFVLADLSAAAQMIPGMKDELSKKINAAPQSIDVGSNGLVGTGTWAEMNSGLTEVIFTEGRAFVLLDFYSSPNNLTPNDVVLDLARKQDAAIKSGLPS
jgi:hypothetical protein